jgi:hypothetical protein
MSTVSENNIISVEAARVVGYYTVSVTPMVRYPELVLKYLRTDIEVGYIPGMITRGYLRTAPNIA